MYSYVNCLFNNIFNKTNKYHCNVPTFIQLKYIYCVLMVSLTS